MNLHNLTIKFEDRPKEAFWASDINKPSLDLYFAFKGEPKTNPPKWQDTLKWGAGKGMEDSALKILQDSGFVNEDYDQKENGRVEMVREGVPVTGYIDAITKDGLPVEIKSINNKNSFDIRKYESGEPRENYVGQLCVYMDFLGVDRGYLFVSSIDGLHTFIFECNKVGERKFKCANTEIDLDKEYKRWSSLYKNNIQTDTMPDLFEYRYKVPVKEIDWSKVSQVDISKARNGHKVIGDWQVAFSNWKDKIVELQGSEIGYSREEIDFIREKTKGYTTWSKK